VTRLRRFPEPELVRLPIDVRPEPGEPISTYIRRLARANHLRPSFFAGLVAGPPNWAGKPDLNRLASFAGRDAELLSRTLSSDSAALLRPRANASHTVTETAERELFFRVRADARGRGLTVRRLAERHKISRRIVRRALKQPELPSSEILRGRPPVVGPLRDLIDPMINEGLNARDIWDRLLDDHDIVIGYQPVLSYTRERLLSRLREPHAAPLRFH
jgi:hypothetical protein